MRWCIRGSKPDRSLECCGWDGRSLSGRVSWALHIVEAEHQVVGSRAGGKDEKFFLDDLYQFGDPWPHWHTVYGERGSGKR